MKTKFKILLMLFVAMNSISMFAQRTSDIENSKDYPLVSRFKGAVIEFYQETKWGTYKLPVSEKGLIDWDKPKSLEGKVIRIQYTTSTENNSEFVLQNYKTAFTKAGFTILIAIANEQLGVSDRPHTWGDKYYETGGYYNGLNNIKFGMGIKLPIWKNNHSFIAAKGNREGKDIYVIVYTVVDDKYTLITQDIIEFEAVTTGMVTATEISKDIDSKGHIALYNIYFETGMFDIKPESAPSLSSIAEYLNSNPAKKFFIVGHTDNAGDFNANMTLSENRAKAVMNELISKYSVKSDQIRSFGIASLSPVTSNSTEDGKSKNRRVEIVIQ